MSHNKIFESFEQVINLAPLGIHFVDANGIVLWANDQELKNLGYKAEEICGQAVSSFHEDPQAIADILNKTADFNGVQNYPVKLIHKNKQIIYALISANAYKENGEFKHTRSFTNLISKEAYEIFKQEQIIKNNFKLQTK